MSAEHFFLTCHVVTLVVVLLPSPSGSTGALSSENGEWLRDRHVPVNSSALTHKSKNGAPSVLGAGYHETLRSIHSHKVNPFSFVETEPSTDEAAEGTDEAKAVDCTIQFEGPFSEPPTLSVGPASVPAGPFLTILRDTAFEAGGWIHGFQKGVTAGSTVRFGGSDEGAGEYVSVHPPHGEHVYELLIFDGDYNLGPKLSAVVGLPWENPARALGSEDDLVDDVRAGNPQSTPRIVGRCSTSVSHEQVSSVQDTT